MSRRRTHSQDVPYTGVDLVEIGRAKAFYRAHGRRLDAWFSPAEVAFVRRSRRPHARVAALLAAKEAAFKASGGAWMGPEGFRAIRLVPSPRRRAFSCRIASRRLTLTYSICRNFVLAQCAGIS